ncbi:oxaloacetate-decarboxylating malate dehydrogenase [Pediococcus acidilactici]|uniref:malolactic enzyme n=1 Tax=Pediococcus acidilactici TaxID=1254 RepID=UPI00132A363E|nr:malolactic enzyme [Pediococcus acidilactici]KAF0336641.1 oxaloacetate-decarboxylating malate dehydrogenase [Pediococcus acidilactici]KAF0337326.1 oxaloacetate-decarboxylating malate dehydrogenase [Pediococcus acidilactici]KAF0340067.1 oxaloacetate-decarboxylating malate dehydrogenase [Pediococcus acidilactici]KAF0345496.1 oxaloacetate-decarboxylating malate dehydrogenase [Pediococcus acidilactici]KAF0349203.1 oxaloacetate-decarboxylating malate dehydrogenase [Pediococcus acidilactici]
MEESKMTEKAMSILNNPYLNKGTAFTKAERDQLGLNGLIPPYIQTLDEQVAQTYAQFQTKANDLEKRLFLMQIFNENRVLFYKLFSEHVVEFMPIVYDPTIADTIENYSELYVQSQNATFLSIDDPDNMETALKNAADGRDIRLIVVTDAEGILGIGDWGTNGVDISVGKLMVYTAAAGIDPSQVLPVVLDVGTNNEKLLKDPMYLGNRHERIKGDRYFEFVDQFVQTAENLFPNMYLHFEDFGRDHAAKILNKYKDRYVIFNDDIQGTGIITLAGILGALNISKQKITDQVYLSFGAGTAGAGILSRIYAEMVENGLSEEEAKKHFYMVDKQGLLFDDDEMLTPEQKPFARKRSEFENPEELTDLLSVVKAVHPTIMVGTSTKPGAFTEEVVREMAAHTERPIIFPLSNPTKLAEAKAEDLLKWTDGRALIATGIPVDDIEYNGVTYQIGQANNALVYPGLGLGVIASTAKVLNDTMISKAAHSLGGIVDVSKPGAAVLPPVSKLSEFSQTVAEGIAQSAVDQGLTKETITDVKKAVADTRWTPEY